MSAVKRRLPLMKLIHICEVCGIEEILDSEDAYQLGWDYPPRMGAFGIVSPRTCPNCPTAETVWWAIAMEGKKPDQLTDRQRAAAERMTAEPASITVPEPN
nr:hypothetical protein [Mycobacterium sp. UM_NZ2]